MFQTEKKICRAKNPIWYTVDSKSRYLYYLFFFYLVPVYPAVEQKLKWMDIQPLIQGDIAN
jgi:hypothetical protein